MQQYAQQKFIISNKTFYNKIKKIDMYEFKLCENKQIHLSETLFCGRRGGLMVSALDYGSVFKQFCLG